jgi:hypothetical protein
VAGFVVLVHVGYENENKSAKKYGMTEDDYQDMLWSQGNGCAICGSQKSLVIDHDHDCCEGVPTCGKCTRGLLCSNCNTGLGFFNDDVIDLQNAIFYLEGSRY